MGTSNESAKGAPLVGRRMAAGAIDLAGVGILSAVFLGVPTVLVGGSLPMLAIFGAVLVWSVVPLSLFGSTAGMAIFGLALEGKENGRADFLDVVFRELVGRGFFAAAYLGTFFIGLVGWLTHTAELSAPVGLSLLLTLVALLGLALAAVGHLIVVVSPNGRGLADILARTTVVRRRPAEPESDDEIEREFVAARRRRRLVGGVVGEVLLVAGTIGVPLLVSLHVGSIDPYAVDHTDMRIETWKRRFEANPASEDVAASYDEVLREAGKNDLADQVDARHAAAVKKADASREKLLTAALARAPTDRQTLDLLVKLLHREKRDADARAAWQRYVTAAKTPESHLEYGEWLYDTGDSKDALPALQAAASGGLDTAELHGYLGFTLQDLGRLEEAKVELTKSLAIEPDLEDVQDALDQVTRALTPTADDGGP